MPYRLILIIFLFSMNTASSKHNLYLIPGQGSDYRIFKNLDLDTSQFNLHYIKWVTPEKKATMNSFARKISEKIDTSESFSLIGVSLGGMIACEIKTFLNPKKVVLISSAKSRKELPAQYRFQKYIPLNKITPKNWLRKSALILQPIVEKDRKIENELCDSMLQSKDPYFLKRTINMIINWERKTSDSTLIHIHGDNDNTLPIKNINCTYTILDGSHMMALTKAKEISSILNKIWKDENY